MKESGLLKVIFSRSKEFNSKLGNEVVIISPEGKHDDFGLKSVFEFTYWKGGTQILSDWFKLGFLDSEESPHSFIDKLLKDKEYVSFDKPAFFSLQQEIQRYRTIVKEIGVPDSKKLLLAMNDLVAVKKFNSKEKWLDKAISSKAFKNSLSRTSGAYFAYINAGSVLDGIEFETIGDISDAIFLGMESKDDIQMPNFLKGYRPIS